MVDKAEEQLSPDVSNKCIEELQAMLGLYLDRVGHHKVEAEKHSAIAYFLESDLIPNIRKRINQLSENTQS